MTVGFSTKHGVETGKEHTVLFGQGFTVLTITKAFPSFEYLFIGQYTKTLMMITHCVRIEPVNDFVNSQPPPDSHQWT